MKKFRFFYLILTVIMLNNSICFAQETEKTHLSDSLPPRLFEVNVSTTKKAQKKKESGSRLSRTWKFIKGKPVNNSVLLGMRVIIPAIMLI